VTPAAKPRLTDCDIILVNSSAGKDSQATLDLVAGAAREAGVLDRLVVAHTDLGDAEWDGVPQLAAEHAAHYGLRFEIARRTHDGTVETRTGRWLPMLLRPRGRGVRK
jgi:3'-phosphoadenosine 5'-phosphosulfate sulfotransferase (PAPS reductase)/FAD synthetase